MTEEEKILRDKEAVKSMMGAKASMESCLNRIKLLEGSLEKISRDIGNIKEAFGERMIIQTYNYSTSQKEFVNAIEYCEKINQFIKTRL